jgi:hypothetical protein
VRLVAFVAAAALLVQRALPRLSLGEPPRSVALAMLLAGCAITIKTSTFAEAGFLGLICLITLLRSPFGTGRALRIGLVWAALGLAPTLAIATGYWLDGHGSEFWHAMITANLSKPPSWPDVPRRAGIMLALLVPLLIPAVLGLIAQERGERRFLLGWLGAALVGLAAMPNFYIHYALPLLVPLCLAASTFLARQPIGLAATAALTVLALALAPAFQFAHTARSRAAIAELTREIRVHQGPGPLLLYDAPPQLYRAAGQPFATPLVFPTHLSHLIERDVSQFSTLGETRRILALKPGAVAMAVYPRNLPTNAETRHLVLAYVGQHCRLIHVVATPERLGDAFIAVWGNCRG